MIYMAYFGGDAYDIPFSKFGLLKNEQVLGMSTRVNFSLRALSSAAFGKVGHGDQACNFVWLLTKSTETNKLTDPPSISCFSIVIHSFLLVLLQDEQQQLLLLLLLLALLIYLG